ncbi:MAG: pyruvate kinase [Thermodesulfobacteriota bacterium]|nr:pyruvate kinase [Thermodesulfobacteriota bacterium]
MRRARLGRRPKIVATLGPASCSVEMISGLVLAGMNVARINMSHGTHTGQAALIANVRRASALVGLEVAILLDLQGPKIRVGEIPNSLALKKGDIWAVGATPVRETYPAYRDRFIPTTYDHLVDDCHDGARILFNDGLIVAEAVERDGDVYKIRVIAGGTLQSNKGINLPDARISAPSLTDRDREDLLFGIEQAVDYVALSFVRKSEDVLHLRDFLTEHHSDMPIVAKIESREATKNIGAILNVTDVVMVARGDMGVELGNHLVPSVQKKIISLCNLRGIPVITATQMLESMIENPTPTRAEASDVANAIWDGTDAVMLSGETAVGKYPLEAVHMMGSIIREAEKTPKEKPNLRGLDLSSVDDAIMIGAALMAEKLGAKRILSVTQSGNSCLRMCRFRPQTSVLGVSNSLSVVRRMCLYWGVSPFYLHDYDEDDKDLEHYVIDKVRVACELEPGDKIVITRGTGRFFARGTSNSVRVEVIKQ